MHSAVELAHSISRFQGCVIHDTHQFLLTLSRLPQLQQPNSRSSSALLTYLLQRVNGYAEVAAARADGTVFASWPAMKEDRQPAEHLDWYRRLVHTSHVVIGGYQAGESGTSFISVAQPLLDHDGGLREIFIAKLDLSYLNHYLAQNSYPPKTTVRLLDHEGIVLARYPQRKQSLGRPLAVPTVLREARRNGDGTIIGPGGGDTRHIYGFSRIGSGPDAEYMVVDVPQAVAYASADRYLVQSLGLLLTVLVLALLGSWYVGDVHVLRKVKSPFGGC